MTAGHTEIRRIQLVRHAIILSAYKMTAKYEF